MYFLHVKAHGLFFVEQGVSAPLILNFRNRQRSVFCFAPQALLPPWKSLQYPQKSSQSGHFGEQKNFLLLLENKPWYICLKPVVHGLVIISIILNRFQRVV